jgi:hypothetical protein
MNTPSLPPELEIFKKDVGTWEATVEVRLQPGATPMVSRGVSTSRLAHGGRWLLTDFENETGFSGHGIYGFDPVKKTYSGVWVDSLRTSLTVMEGTWDAPSRTMTFRGEQKRPDGSTVAWREVTESIDPDHQIFRSFMPGPGGAEFEMMTVTYRRKA